MNGKTSRTAARAAVVCASILLVAGCASLDKKSGGSGLPVSPPKTPKGPSVGKVGEKLTFVTEGSDPLNVHEYQYDWGDGTAWKWVRKGEKQSHVYSRPGTFSVRAREKCPWNAFVTDWSKARVVAISG